MYALIPIALSIVTIAVLYLRLRRIAKLPLVCEYWVFSPSTDPGDPNAAMDLMLRSSPWPGAISKREGILFSDIRLNVALVLRTKNPQLFRPDLDDPPAEVSAKILSDLAACNAFLKIEYISTSPVPDDRHLTFLPHMAWAYAELNSASLILDRCTNTFYGRDEFRSYINCHDSLESFDAQVTIRYCHGENGMGSARAVGFSKIGLPDLVSMPAPHDQQHLLTEITEIVARKLWKDRTLESMVMIHNALDEFMIQVLPTSRRARSIRVHRIVARD